MFLYYGSYHQCEWWNFHVGNSTKNINKKYPYLRNIYHHFFCIDLLQENITLTNLTGSFSISKMDGSFTIAGIDGKPLIKRGHFKVMTSAGEFTSLCGNVKCEILQKAEREILISYKDYNSPYMDFNLHVSCLEDCFSFTLGARRVNSSNREEYVYKLFPFIGDWDGKFSGSLSLLRFAYCGAHTGSNLSTSGLVPLNDESYKDLYGALYNWYAAGYVDLCPSGWHVPSDLEWETLSDFLIDNGYGYQGSGIDISKALAATTNWDYCFSPGDTGNDPASNNSSGFSGLPAGHRSFLGGYSLEGNGGYWWSRTQYDSGLYAIQDAWTRQLKYQSNYFMRNWGGYNNGFSVRCIKD